MYNSISTVIPKRMKIRLRPMDVRPEVMAVEHTHTEQVEPDMIPLAAVTAIVPNMEAILLAPDEAVMAVLATEVTKPTEQLLLAPITPHVSKPLNG